MYFELVYTEICATFLFVFFIMCVKYHNDCSVDLHNCFAIGIALYACGTFASKLSGGCLNPAVAIIQQWYQSKPQMNIGDPGVLSNDQWYTKMTQEIHQTGISMAAMSRYFLGTLTGGVLAGAVSLFRNFSTQTLEASAKEEEMNGQIN